MCTDRLKPSPLTQNYNALHLQELPIQPFEAPHSCVCVWGGGGGGGGRGGGGGYDFCHQIPLNMFQGSNITQHTPYRTDFNVTNTMCCI